jgi:hypothetical protein
MPMNSLRIQAFIGIGSKDLSHRADFRRPGGVVRRPGRRRILR